MDTSLLWLTLLGCTIWTASSEAPPPTSTAEVSGFRMMFNAYRQCSDQQEMVVCLKSRALRMLDRAIQMENIPITDGISLVKKSEANGRSLGDAENAEVAENVIPENSADFGKQVDSMLYEKLSRFARSRSLQLSVPQLFDESRDLDDGRKKKKDKGGHMYMMMLKGGLLAMAYKGLALLAGKALLVSKIALTLALLVAFKKLFGGGGGGGGGSSKTTYEIVKQPLLTHSHQYAAPAAADTFGSYDNSGPYARSIAQSDVPYPQLAAYRAHVKGGSGPSGGGGGGGGPMIVSSASSPAVATGVVQHDSNQRDEAL